MLLSYLHFPNSFPLYFKNKLCIMNYKPLHHLVSVHPNLLPPTNLPLSPCPIVLGPSSQFQKYTKLFPTSRPPGAQLILRGLSDSSFFARVTTPLGPS